LKIAHIWLSSFAHKAENNMVVVQFFLQFYQVLIIDEVLGRLFTYICLQSFTLVGGGGRMPIFELEKDIKF
jgi:hypothetical protein